MKRLIANILVAAGGLTASSQLLALGLGELKLQSALNQPLRAEIELVDSKGLTEWEIKPSLASQADFERAGVERDFFLTSITFKVEGNRIVLSSREPVNEPFLNFLVELNWPSGRVLREYTLLLDPPVFEETSYLPAVKAPVTAAATVTAPAQSAPAAVNRWEAEPAAAGTYKVKKDDTLWDVALQTRPSAAVTPQQMMIALQRHNPDAFIGGNINRLKSHHVLRVPDEETVRAITLKKAVAEVARQNRALQPGAAQVDATGRGAEAAASRAGQPGGEVRLVTAGTEEAQAAVAGGAVTGGVVAGRQQTLENDLAIALENVDKGRRENEELRKRLEVLEEQINTLQRLISLKNDQLAGMQLSDEEVAAATAAATAAAVVETETETGAADVEAAAEATEQAGVDFNYSAPSEQDVAADAGAESVPQAENAEAVAAREEAEAKARRDRIAAMIAEQEQQRPQLTLLEQLMANPLIPAGAVALLLVLLLLVVRMLTKRREQKPEEPVIDEQALTEFAAADVNDSTLDEFDFDDDELLDKRTPDIQPPVAEQEEHEEHFETVAQTEDAISESDIYIAYGKFEQAVDLLRSAIEQEPSRTDLRLKLLEVYVEMDDSRAFASAEGELASLGDRAAIDEARNMRQRLSSPMEPAVAGLAALTGAAAADSLSLDDEIPELDADLSDEFAGGLDFGDALDMADAPAAVVSLDDTESKEDDVPVLDAGPDAQAHDALDFDFDIGTADESAAQAEAPAVAATPDFDDALDFDLSEFDADETAEGTAANEADVVADALVTAEEDLLEFDIGSLNDAAADETSNDELADAAEVAEVADAEMADDAVESLVEAQDELLDFNLSAAEAESATDAEGEVDLSAFDADSAAATADAAGADEAIALDSLESLLDGEAEGDGDLSELSFDLDDSEDLAAETDVELSDADLTALDHEFEGLDDDLGADLSELSEDLEASSAAVSEDDGLAADAFDLNDISALTEESLAEVDEFSLEDVPALTEAADDVVVEQPEDGAVAEGGEIDLDELAAADNEFDFLAGTDECATKLDLARAYIDMEDFDGARELLQEVMQEGSDQQKSDARSLLTNMA